MLFMMIKVTESMNVYDPALFTINNMGYTIFLRLNEKRDNVERWIARKEGSEFVAMNPLSLLGIIMIGELYGEDWRNVDYGNMYDTALDSVGL